MRLGVVAVGRLKSGPERTLVERYRERIEALGRPLGISPFDITEMPESRARRDADRRGGEAAANAAKVAAASPVAFDERGKTVASDAFAARIGGWRDAGRPALACAI